MSRRLNIKQFKVADVTTGRISQSGREPVRYTSESTIINDLSQNASVTNKLLTQITNSTLDNHAHFSRSYIKIITDYTQDISSADEVFIPDRIMRITYLSSAGATYNSALLYAFSPYSSTKINELEWNVAIANTKSQQVGDYFDIELPDSTYYPSLYVCFLIVKDAWVLREIINSEQKICKLNNVSRIHYCIHPQLCYYDPNKSHYICCNGIDRTTGIKTRIVFGVEDDRHAYYCDTDYSDLIFSLSSRTYLNENDLW